MEGEPRRTNHAARKTTCHQREADKQEQPCPPDCTRVAEALISTHTVLVNEINDKHAEQRGDAWNPVDERDVDRRRNLRVLIRGVCVRG
jgi:hypothetical protein